MHAHLARSGPRRVDFGDATAPRGPVRFSRRRPHASFTPIADAGILCPWTDAPAMALQPLGRLAMPYVKFNTALIVGAGSGLSAALARVLDAEGIKVALAARSTADLADLAKEIGAPTFTCDATQARRRGEAVRRSRRRLRRAGDRDLQPELPHARADGRARSGRGREDADGLRLRRLPGGAAGGQAHAAEEARLHRVHRRVREREGLCAVGAVRDGQVRAARAGAEHGARAAPARASTSRMS